MPKKYERVICPKCKNWARDYTVKKYGGVCYFCFKGQKRTSRPIKELPRETEPLPGETEEIVDLQEAKDEYAKKKIFFDKHQDVAIEQFLRWYMADPATRKPQDRREVAKVLECTQTQLDIWWRSKVFREMYDKRRYDKIYYGYSHRIDETLAKQAVAGNKDSIKKWFETYGKVEKPRTPRSLGGMSDKLKGKLKETLDKPEENMGGSSLKEEEQGVVSRIRDSQ